MTEKELSKRLFVPVSSPQYRHESLCSPYLGVEVARPNKLG